MVQKIAPELGSKPGHGEINSQNIPSLKYFIVMSKRELPGAYCYEDILNSGSTSEVAGIQEFQREIQPDLGCNIQFTSGTTGKAKGTLLSHHNMVNNSYVLGKNIGLNSRHHRICLSVPFFHCFGNVIGVLSALHHGSTLVLPAASFKPRHSIRAISEERCTVLYGTPTMYYDMLAAAKEEAFQVQGTDVEVAVNGGALCSQLLFNSLLDTFGLKRVCSVYGMTETSPVSFQSRPDDNYEQMTTTVGHVHEHMEVKVVDLEGRIVPMGTPGELMVRGYATMLGYWNEEQKTKEMIGEDRWLKTGDQFVLHENGYGQIVGRIKDMIIRGGENIFPKEVEQFLETHSKIREVQVFGIPDARLGEEVCVCLRLEEGAKMTEEEIKRYCIGKLSHFKIPRFIRFVEDFPKTISGKIQKFKLQEMMIQEIRKSK